MKEMRERRHGLERIGCVGQGPDLPFLCMEVFGVYTRQQSFWDVIYRCVQRFGAGFSMGCLELRRQRPMGLVFTSQRNSHRLVIDISRYGGPCCETRIELLRIHVKGIVEICFLIRLFNGGYVAVRKRFYGSCVPAMVFQRPIRSERFELSKSYD